MKLFLRLLVLIVCALWRHQALAQQLCNFGGRAAGMGNASVTHTDVWALGNNTAGLTGVQQPQLGLYVENRFGESAFTTVALQAAYPTKRHGTYGLSLSRFGDALFSQQHVGVGAAHKLGQFSVGAKADVWQVAVAGYGNQKAVTLSAGVQGEVVPNVYFGAFAYNLNQAQLATFEDERLPTVMKAGLAYRPTTRLLLAAETEKDIDHRADVKAGAEYAVLEGKFVLRTGFSTRTNRLSAGAGFQARQLQIDYAFGVAVPLGNSHHLALSYRLPTPRPD
ncbi:hypothetical protein MKJ04_12995 [Pontibacter sp. E15-1]|uniref:hypothetical protein n=1 Tax=Pontibacter sp. E15-1 TaxID=2919918 RepID=UPI001F4F877C|nr:hypothetical protein [Pontibacter sp. E15-1]MCJ8165763.1 hypothetical protein [Pontibacter sp. E15-1]